MTYTLYWVVNDRYYGYPNIMADLSQSDVECRGYQETIRTRAKKWR